MSAHKITPNYKDKDLNFKWQTAVDRRLNELENEKEQKCQGFVLSGKRSDSKTQGVRQETAKATSIFEAETRRSSEFVKSG